MVAKIDEVNEENIKDLSLEDLQKLALDGKNDLVSARGVIGDLNKKIKKGPGTEEENKDGVIKKEDLPVHLKELEDKKAMDTFLQNNPVFEDHKEALENASKSGLFGTLEEASEFLMSKDETLKNNVNTNQAGINGGNQNGASTFKGKVPFKEYNEYSEEEQSAYDAKCNEEFGGVTFSDSGSGDDE